MTGSAAGDPGSLRDHQVFCARTPRADYASCPEVRCPELPAGSTVTTATVGLRSLFSQAGLDRERFGRPDWNPLSRLILPGARVLIKPNWVRDYNGSGGDLDCLVTHTAVIEAVVHYVALARPARIVVGDAPVQGCRFDRLRTLCGVDEMTRRLSSLGIRISVKDFRRTIRREDSPEGLQQTDCRPLDEFVLFDLAGDSLLEAITRPGTPFRVTMYNPDLLERTHAPGRHQYLVARDAIDADVVISLPKLKTHKKACVTGALKNVVGINGHKEYLPHHRKGGSSEGGDCYPGRSAIKRLVEDVLDAANRARGSAGRRLLSQIARAGVVLGKMVGEDDNYEGAWRGNDTVWRMSLDLQRVLHYGRADGTLSRRLERTVLTVTDAIVAGEGDGPLSPTRVEFGMMTLGVCAPAVEWVHALLLGLEPRSLPLIHRAFGTQERPLAAFPPSTIEARVDGSIVGLEDLFRKHGRRFRLPRGWREEGAPDRTRLAETANAS
jgi:uncharacterized protein (DUF362 family)